MSSGLAFCIVSTIIGGVLPVAQATPDSFLVQAVPHFDTTPFDPAVLKPDNLPTAAVTATTISLTGLTPPSLWWIKEQSQQRFSEQLVENWIAYPTIRQQPGRVDVVVNLQSWSMLNYLQQYAFIHAFGSAARYYRYNVRVFDSRATFLGAYTCNYSFLTSSTPSSTHSLTNNPDFSTVPAMPQCATELNFGGRASFRGRSNSSP